MTVGLQESNAITGGRWRVPVLCLALLAIFVLCVMLGTVSNDFPESYHMDEASKAKQVITGNFNFRHPLLLLEMTRLYLGQQAKTMDIQSVVEAGRFVSAIFGAITTVSLALAGYCVYGFIGLGLSAAMTGLCSTSLVVSHFMKEDSALGMGVALTILAGIVATRASGRRQSLLAWVGLGVACGVATSGKYVGIATVPYACLLAAAQVPRSLKACAWRCLWVTVAWLVSIVVLNYSAWDLHAPLFLCVDARDSIREAIGHGLGSHSELMMRQPNTFFATVLGLETMPHVWMGVAFLVASLIWAANDTARMGVVAALLSVAVWMLVLSCNRIPFHRYIFPLVIQFHFLAALGFAFILTRVNRPRGLREVGALGVTGMVLAWQGLPCWSLEHQFGDDSRQRVRNWILEHIPVGATIAAESYIGLKTPGDTKRFPGQPPVDFMTQYHLIDSFFVADKGGVQGLKAHGIDYVAVCGLAYERFYYPQVIPVENQEKLLLERQTFYRELHKSARLVYQDISPYPSYEYMNPDILIYQLSACPDSVPSGGHGRMLPFEDRD